MLRQIRAGKLTTLSPSIRCTISFRPHIRKCSIRCLSSSKPIYSFLNYCTIGSTHTIKESNTPFFHQSLFKYSTTVDTRLDHLAEKLRQKELGTNFYRNYENIVPKDDIEFARSSGDLEDFLMCIPSLLSNDLATAGEDHTSNIKFKKFDGLKDIESAFVLVLQTITSVLNPSYHSKYVDECLNAFGKNLKPYPLMVSQEIQNALPFSLTIFQKISKDSNVLIAIQLLKFKLNQEKGWSLGNECRDDNVISWISSLFESTITDAISHLSRTTNIPDIIVFDLLLRKPMNELEYVSLYEIYCKWSREINLKDQEKLYYLKQFDSLARDTFVNRSLIIPPAFANLFNYAVRSKIETLPKLIGLFLDENNTKSSQILQQISEFIWQLSYDHTGNGNLAPSRFYKIAQSKLIRVVNSFTTNDKNFDIDVTTLLGVSNLTFYTSFKKSFTLFKEAKKRFDRWQLESFDIDDFEKVVTAGQADPFQTQRSKSIENVQAVRVDYNIKFLCNSILLLDVNQQNRSFVYKNFTNILKRADIKLLERYPELWEFIMIKLNYHSMLDDFNCADMFQIYLEKFDGHVKDHFVLDQLISHTNSLSLLSNIYEKLEISGFDDLNMSRYISKLYKMAKLTDKVNYIRANTSLGFTDSDLNTQLEGTFYPLIDHYEEVVKPTKELKKFTDRYDPAKFVTKKFKTPLELARYLYASAPFKSSKLNSSYLLGESLQDPAVTYNIYMGMNLYTKITTITISSLFIAALKLQKLGKEIEWISPVVQTGEKNEKPVEISTKPSDVAFREFDQHVCSSYGDFVTGKVYPNDNLLVLYLNASDRFDQKSRIFHFLDRMVDLRYPLKVGLFNVYLKILPRADREELLDCLNEYNRRFNALRQCNSEYELNMMKKKMDPVVARGRFVEFVSKFQFNWSVIRNWEWPGKL